MFNRETQKNWMKSQVAHSLRGRLRLRVEGLNFLNDEKEEIAQMLANLPGVQCVQVTPITCGILLRFDPTATDTSILCEGVDVTMARYAMNAYRNRQAGSKPEEPEVSMTTRQLTKRLALNAGAVVLGHTILPGSLLGGAMASFTSLEALTSLGLTMPMARSAAAGLRRDMRPNADFLTVTSIVASLLLGTPHSALMILALSDLAELMTSYTIERTRSSIKQMLSVEDGEVWKVLTDGRLEKTPIGKLEAGDTIEVHTGEKIAVDGTVVSGSAVVDQSAITGEFVPAEKRKDAEVFAGTVVKNGNMQIQAQRVGDQTVVSRIVGMVEQSELKKAPIQRYADKFSNYLVPLNFLLCAAVWLVTRNPQKALKMLVIDYSCGIKLSTATAFSAAINTAVKRGVLIKGGAYIEQMSSANTVLLDKTGTITEGRPRVTGMTMLTDTMDEAEVLSLAMAAEETSTHPLASAILTYGRAHGAKIPPHGEIVTEVSRGSRTEVDGKCIRVGNLKYMKENGVRADGAIPDANGAIPNYVGVGDKIVAVLYAMDNPRANVRRAINALRYDGVGDIELLTGDMAAQAQAVAEMVGVDGYQAQLLPEQKAEAVLKLQTQGNGVVMVGDGINDAPALARADVGIAIGAGTDVAIESADIVLMRSDLLDVSTAVQLSRAVIRNIKENLFWAFFYNAIGIPIAAGVFYPAFQLKMNPMLGALAMSFSSVFVVSNALRLRWFKAKHTEAAPKTVSSPSDRGVEIVSKEIMASNEKGETNMEKVISIEGMACMHCVNHVQQALSAVPGVKEAKVDLESKSATVSVDGSVTDAALKAAVDEAGYQAVSIR